MTLRVSCSFVYRVAKRSATLCRLTTGQGMGSFVPWLSPMWLMLFLIVHTPVTPLPAVMAGEFAYIANSNDNTVSVIDIDGQTVATTIAVGSRPIDVAASENGDRVFVLNDLDETVSVIDTATNAVIAAPSISPALLESGVALPIDPKRIVASPDGSKVYASGLLAIVELDVVTGQLITLVHFNVRDGTLLFHPDGFILDISFDGTQLFYTGNVGELFQFTIATGQLTNFGKVALNEAVYVSNDGSIVFNQGLLNLYIVDLDAFMTDSISISTGQDIKALTVSPDNQRAYLLRSGFVNQPEFFVAVLDIASEDVIAEVPVGRSPDGIDITSDGQKLVVPNTQDNTVTIIDTQALAVLETVQVGATPLALKRFIASGAGTPVPPETCDGLAATILGTPAGDVLIGTPGNDIIAGLGGDDVIDGLEGDDVICGGPGRDVMLGGAGNDRIFGGPDDDVLVGEDGDDMLFGEEGNDVLNAGAGVDSCDGGPGEDAGSGLSCEMEAEIP